jgi:hypothetical protein
MRAASKKHAGGITKRGLVGDGGAKVEVDKGVDPMIVGLFVFVVCGSAIFSLLNSMVTGSPTPM